MPFISVPFFFCRASIHCVISMILESQGWSSTVDPRYATVCKVLLAFPSLLSIICRAGASPDVITMLMQRLHDLLELKATVEWVFDLQHQAVEIVPDIILAMSPVLLPSTSPSPSPSPSLFLWNLRWIVSGSGKAGLHRYKSSGNSRRKKIFPISIVHSEACQYYKAGPTSHDG